ncbi:hypothetical protein NQZ68_037786, partial [Dissostichus eleginoides]
FASLDCGETYNFTVTADSQGCRSQASSTVSIQTEPCQPVIVSAQMLCQSEQVQISWYQASGVVNYLVTTTGSLGYVKIHNATQSIPAATLPCGQDYNVTVQAQGSDCDSIPSSPAFFKTAPCPPSDVTTYAQCEFNMGSVSWGSSDGAETYVAVATGLDGHAHQCLTNSTDCSWNDLLCGEEYTVVVRARNGNCTSLPSNSSIIYMDPCVPQNLAATVNCDMKVVSLSWDASNGTNVYMVSGEAGNETTVLTTNVTKAHFSGFSCGLNYILTVTPQNQHCPGNSSASASIQTWPCPPAGVSTRQDCLSGIVMVMWQATNGSDYYTATMQTDTGISPMCMSDSNECSVPGLTCGQNFSSSNQQCNITSSHTTSLQSVPCVPTNVSVVMDCDNNTAVVSWTASQGALQYSLMAHSSHNNVSCQTSSLNCSLDNISCGNSYSVQVVAMDDNCSSIPSQALVFNSAPCPPQNRHCRSQQSQAYSIMSAPCQPERISGRLDCVTNSAWISWDAAPGADSYTVSAVGEDNYTGNCTSSSNTTCEVEDLACGSLYNFSVIAKNSKCESQPSATIDLQTEGNTVYTATAEASDHTYLSCNNTGTSCYLHGAQCGLHYTIIVAASSDQCSSLRSPPYRISMEPCPPSNVVVGSTCADDSAVVSWSPSLVAETYHVVAMGANGHVHTCNTTSSNCSISELHCGQQYDISVTASHENCTSKASQNATLNTGPCQPDGLSVISHCNNQSALLSWTPGDNAVDYYGCAQAENGDMLYCESTNPSCTIQGLDCGTLYNFTVQASDGTCNSSVSEPVQSGAAPCPPDSVDVELFTMQNEAQILYFNWTQITCRDTEYLLELNGSLLGDSQALFEISSYWTSMTYFEIPLPCGSSYWATVESRNTGGTSQPSVPLSGTTAPCPPIAVEYSGNNTFATVSWNTSVFATSYTVYDNSVTPRSQLCSTAGLSCSLHSITSTDLVITASNTAGDSEETIQPAHQEAGRSRESEEITVQGESIILTDLIPNSAYCFSVSAEYTATSGPESEP